MGPGPLRIVEKTTQVFDFGNRQHRRRPEGKYRVLDKKEPAWGPSSKTALYRSGNGPHQKTTLRSPWSWTSSLWNYKKINFCHLSHMVCGTLLWQPEPRPRFLKITDPMLCGTNLAMYEGPNFSTSSLTLAADYLNYLETNPKALSPSPSFNGKRMTANVIGQF